MNNSALQETVLSRKEAAAFLGISKTTLDRAEIPRSKIRKRILYRQSVLIQWLAKNENREAKL